MSSKPALKILLHTFYATGHVLPMQAVAKALVARGHEVVWLAAPPQEARVLASGARFVPQWEIVRVDKILQDSDPQTLDEIVEVFFGGRLLAQAADLRRALKDFSPDILLNDALSYGAASLYELGEVPFFATLGVVPMYLPGEGIHKPKSPLGKLLSQAEISLPCLNKQRVELGLKPLKAEEQLQYSPLLHIQASCPELEYNQEIHPAKYVGPLVSPLNKTSVSLPTWWGDVLKSPCVIGITQGTFAMDPTLLLIPAIEALKGDEDLLLVVPSLQADEIRKKIDVPGNVRIAEWVPYDLLLPQCRILITNGGYGSVTQALAHGVPLICAGTSEDKIDTAARVTFVGAGIDLKTDSPSADQMRSAVREILEDPKYRENAVRVSRELNGGGGAERVCDILEDAVAEKS